MLTKRGFLWVLAALSILAAALAFGAPGAAAQNSPSKPATPAPPNEEYLRKVIKWNPWFLAAASGDAKTIQDYLTSGTQVNARDTFGRTALYVATAYEHADIVRLLLKSGADPNLPSEELPRMYVVSGGKHPPTQTTLEMASRSENEDIQAVLTGTGAKMVATPSYQKRMEGLPPICQSIEDQSTPTLLSLLKEGSFVRESSSHSDFSVPRFALSRGRVALYSILLEQGLGPSGTLEEKNALLEAAVGHCRSGDARRLLNAGASAASVPGSQLSNAISKRDKEFLRMMLDAGTKPAAWLMYDAVRTGDLEIVQLLENHGLTVQGEKGRTPLAVAINHGNIGMVSYLLGRGADPNPGQQASVTFVEEAVRGRRQDIADLLVRNGATPISEKRRSQLLTGRYDSTVTTQTVVSAELLSTRSLGSIIDLNRYNLHQVTRVQHLPGYDHVERYRLLVFAGSADRIPVGSVGMQFTSSFFLGWPESSNYVPQGEPKEWVRTKWIEPGKIAVVIWLVGYYGSGGIAEEWTSLLLVNGTRVKPVFTWNYEMHAASGVSYWQNADQTWSWDVSQR
ncbi:MAG: ankyrin repeat domain-containing protein, partial [Candidatus Aureabacteria bacterium]|nr:ankyrin repeat domain-containing protein [Candidatus Auribacterota bacterium]